MFKKRMSSPTSKTKWYKDSNPFYNTKYSMFKGHPKLGNCTHYVYSRISEIKNEKSNLPSCDAINWYNKTKYNKGNYPKIGAIICYKHGNTGHVAVIEDIDESGNLTLSMSGWNSYLFKTKIVYKKNKYCYSNYDLLGFIYPLNYYKNDLPILPKRGYFIKGDKGIEIKKLQMFLNWHNKTNLLIDGILGNKTFNEVKIFQKNNYLKEDGLFGIKSLNRAKYYK